MGTYPTKIIAKSRPMSPRPNWPHPLTQPLKIPGIMDLVTLADVRTLLGRQQTKSRDKSTWLPIEGLILNHFS
jgi:hypothetical protein